MKILLAALLLTLASCSTMKPKEQLKPEFVSAIACTVAHAMVGADREKSLEICAETIKYITQNDARPDLVIGGCHFGIYSAVHTTFDAESVKKIFETEQEMLNTTLNSCIGYTREQISKQLPNAEIPTKY